MQMPSMNGTSVARHPSLGSILQDAWSVVNVPHFLQISPEHETTASILSAEQDAARAAMAAATLRRIMCVLLCVGR